MEIYTHLSVTQVLDRAELFMLSQGANMTGRTAESVSFERRPPWTCGEEVLLFLSVVFTFGVALLYVVFRMWWKDKARLMARSSGNGRIRVLIDGDGRALRAELEEWAGSAYSQ